MQIAVLGAGTMGHGIAQVAAMAGHEVTIRDVESEFLENGLSAIETHLEDGVERGKVPADEADATLDRIEGTTDLPAAVTDARLVIEAIPEDLGLKQETFQAVEVHVEDDALLATNTSALSVTEIASSLDVPGRFLGLHFFNPPHLMDLVEIVVADQTTTRTRDRGETFVEGLGKTPIVVRDSAGFATSRLGSAQSAEAMRMLQERVATPRDLDTAMKLGYNHPMGPIELADVVGLDVQLDILEYLRVELGERFHAPQILRRKVRAGTLGQKNGTGFYVWEDGEIVEPADDWGACK